MKKHGKSSLQRFVCWVDRSIDIAPGGRDDHWVLAVRLDLTVAKNLVGNPSSGDSGVNSVFSPVSLQRIDPISLRDPAARASFRELLKKLHVESRGNPYQVTEMWRRGFESAALQCFKQKVPSKKVRKTWISEFSLSQMQQVGSIRRARENMHVKWNRAVGGLAFYAWACRDGRRARCLVSMTMLAKALRPLDVGIACVTVQLRILSKEKDNSIKKRPACQISVHVTGNQWCRCER